MERKPTDAERIKQLEEELAKAKAPGAGLTIKISPKGGLSVYGLGRFPVTLYGGQWEKLDAFMPKVRDYIAENRSKMAWKDS